MKNILMVHDHETYIKVTVDYLKSKGYNAVGIHNRQEAIKYIQDNKPDLVLLGLYFVYFLDIDLFKEIRKKYPDVPVWVFQNIYHDDIDRELNKLKPDDWIEHIVKMDKLLEKIEVFFGKKTGVI